MSECCKAAVAAEREACAVECEEWAATHEHDAVDPNLGGASQHVQSALLWRAIACRNMANRIRERGK